MRLLAFEHGIRAGYKWAGMTLDRAVTVSTDFERAAIELARGRRTAAEVKQSWWSAPFKSAFDGVHDYESQLKLLLHTPDGPNCEAPNVEADVLDPVTPELPDDMGAIRVTVGVRVQINPAGKVTDLSITPATSSGNSFLDRAALMAARYSTYVPKIQNCVAVPGTYMFAASFESK